MRTVLLTTDTTHHLYYAWQLSRQMPLTAIFLETRRLRPPFETAHPYEARQVAYEQAVLLGGCPPAMDALADTRTVTSMNDPAAVAVLRALRPDVILVFGTGLLHDPVIAAAPVCLNLHGGNPERYRGLDTHLWAIYHRDFDDLVTTLHHVDAELDTGAIVFQQQLALTPGMPLHTLRAVNTRACVNMSLLALQSLATLGWLPSRKQVQRGRYYSAMPADLKAVCLARFERHVDALTGAPPAMLPQQAAEQGVAA